MLLPLHGWPSRPSKMMVMVMVIDLVRVMVMIVDMVMMVCMALLQRLL